MVSKCCEGYSWVCRGFSYFFVIPGIILSCLACASCRFVIRRGGLGMGLFQSEIQIGENLLGEPTTICRTNEFGDSIFGWLYMWARVCGAIAPILGFVAFGLGLFDCFCKVCCANVIQTIVLGFAELSQILTALIYASNACLIPTGSGKEYSGLCRPGEGSVMSFVAFGLWFVGGFFLCCSPAPNPIFCTNGDEEAAGAQKTAFVGEGGGREKPEIDEEGGKIAEAQAASVEDSEGIEVPHSETAGGATQEEAPSDPQVSATVY